MRKLGFGNLARIMAAFCVASAVASPAQTFTTLFRFDGTHGQDAKYCPLRRLRHGLQDNPGGKINRSLQLLPQSQLR